CGVIRLRSARPRFEVCWPKLALACASTSISRATARWSSPTPARWDSRVRDHHTRSLCAESPAQIEQWCCWLCRRRIIFGPTCARGRGMLAAGPELRIPGAAAQTRVVSLAGIRLDSRKSVRPFKGIICDDISEFESHMPSPAARSPPLSPRYPEPKPAPPEPSPVNFDPCARLLEPPLRSHSGRGLARHGDARKHKSH